MDSSIAVSVLIPARNEVSNIRQCIQSVKWAGEVVVIDSGSEDGTTELAQSLGATVIQFEYQAGGPKKKNWALRHYGFRHQWVLILDADERIPDGLAAEIIAAIGSGGGENGFYLNRRFWFLGQWIRYAGYFPSWNLRLVRRGFGYYEDCTDVDTASGDNEVHEHMIVEGLVGRLRTPMDHYAFPDLATFIEKHNRYSNWEARIGEKATQSLRANSSQAGKELSWRRKLKAVGRRLPFADIFRFFYHYVVKIGVLDGYAGYVLCRLLGQYEFWISVKTREIDARRHEALHIGDRGHTQ
jgi:glycosyltransferase involved in cell wall biosynthesis